MLIPLHDANALRHISAPVVTRGLIIVNVLIYLVMAPASLATLADHLVVVFGFIPSLVEHMAVLPAELRFVPPEVTYVTYSFLHGSFMHVALNMLFLYIFGDNVEDALGHVRFLIFYLACAAAGAFMHQVLSAMPDAPLIGASGAISGVVIAYALLHPHVRLWVLVFFGIPLPLPAFIPLGFWIGQQFFELITGYGDSVSFAAHAGGIIAGGILVLVLRRRGVPLFDREMAPRARPLRKPVPGEVWSRNRDGEKGAESGAEATRRMRWGR